MRHRNCDRYFYITFRSGKDWTPLLAFVVNHRKLKRTNIAVKARRPGWALVRVRMAGICNTDIEILRGYHNFCGKPGHEFFGESQDVSGGSAAFKKSWGGKRVAGEINIAGRGLG